MKLATGSNPILTVFVSDDSGKGVTGLIAATFPSLSYVINGANASVAFPPLNDLATMTAAYNAGGIKERSGGYYRVDGPTGITATEGSTVTLIGEATGQHVICPSIDIGAVTLAAIRTEMDTNSTKLSNLDAAISTRLAASGYTAPTTPPTVAAIRTEMDTNSTKLANLDATVSSRLATSGYTAPTPPPTVTAIRIEMDSNSTKLANLDTTISSRLASTAYVAAPTVVQIRQEIDANSMVLASVATASGVIAASNSVKALMGSPLQASSYVAAPSADSVAAATAALLFVDGSTNRLKVNPDHTVNTSGESGSIANYITIPAAVAVASQDPAVITCVRGDTLRIALPVMGDLTSRTRLVMTAKSNINDFDSQAVFQVVEGAGLTCLNGSIPADASLASLTVTNASTGAVNLFMSAKVTAELAVRDLVWDAQASLSTGIVSPLRGTLVIVADVTQAVT